MSPEEQALAQASQMNQGMMGFGSMQPPKTGNILKDFILQALMQGSMGLKSGAWNSPTTNMNSRALSISEGVNRGPNMYNPVRHNFMGKPTNGNFTGEPANYDKSIVDVLKSANLKSANNPLGLPKPNSPGIEWLVGKNEGKGNFGLTDFDRLNPEANYNPGPRHKNVGEPSEGPNASEHNQIAIARENQRLRELGHDPRLMSLEEKMRVLYPYLYEDK